MVLGSGVVGGTWGNAVSPLFFSHYAIFLQDFSFCLLQYPGVPPLHFLGLHYWSWDDLIESLRSAARLIGRLHKFAPVSACMCDVLHGLPVSQRISYRIAVMVCRCVVGFAPSYLRDLCR